MEWVETTSPTVEEAKDRLLDRLGVDEDEAEFEILEEPKSGLFGRMRGQARVRARVMPKTPRAKEERRRRGGNGNKKPARSGGSSSGGAKPKAESSSAPAKAEAPAAASSGSGDGGSRAKSDTRRPAKDSAPREELPPADAEAIGAAVTGFLQGLVDAFGLEGTAGAEVVDGEVLATIDGSQLGFLIGPGGGVVDAVQELSRTFSQKESKGAQAPRVKVDVGSYRANRKVQLEAFVRTVADQVKESGEAVAFEPMGSVDRKTVHDTAGEIDGLSTISEGEDPRRKVVILPA